MTQEQKQFIVDVLSKITLSAVDPNATQNIEMIQSIVKELTKEEIK